MAASTPNTALADSAEQSIEVLLFAPSTSSTRSERKALTEQDVRHISESLQRMGRASWSQVPRLYTVLRLVNQVQVIDSFIKQGVSDLWFPFDIRTLPDALRSPSSRYEFLEAQDLVLTKAFDLEREDGKHRHFSSPDDVPMRKLEELGKGGFGYVDRVISTITFKEYARKLIPRGRTFQKNIKVLKDFERELGHLKKLSHNHIVELVGSYTDPKFVGIIMSPVAEYNLKDFLALAPLPSGKLSFLRTFFGCLAAAVCYLHDNQIRHKDIKPQNVLVKGHQIYLTDFGISLDWSDLDQSTTTGDTKKTPRYCAPEVAQSMPRNSSSDLWSLGCVFLEIWTALKGRTILNLLDFLGSSGSKSTCYYLNRDASIQWCKALESASGPEENPPLPCIYGLLQPDQNIRWTARELVNKIKEINENPETRFAFSGICCIEDDDSTGSASSSKRSSQALDETGASSIRVYHHASLATDQTAVGEHPFVGAPFSQQETWADSKPSVSNAQAADSAPFSASTVTNADSETTVRPSAPMKSTSTLGADAKLLGITHPSPRWRDVSSEEKKRRFKVFDVLIDSTAPPKLLAGDLEPEERHRHGQDAHQIPSAESLVILAEAPIQISKRPDQSISKLSSQAPENKCIPATATADAIEPTDKSGLHEIPLPTPQELSLNVHRPQDTAIIPRKSLPVRHSRRFDSPRPTLDSGGSHPQQQGLLQGDSRTDSTTTANEFLGRSTSVHSAEYRIRRQMNRDISEGVDSPQPAPEPPATSGSDRSTGDTEQHRPVELTDKPGPDESPLVTPRTPPSVRIRSLERARQESILARRQRREEARRDLLADVPGETDADLREDGENGAIPDTPRAEISKPIDLKGLFSVSTTSGKSVQFIRHNIILALKELGVEYTEIKGGFTCRFAPFEVLSEFQSGHGHATTDDLDLRFHIYIVKIPLIGHGIQFKKLKGGMNQYRQMTQQILESLRL